MLIIQPHSLRLPTSEGVFCGVTLEPYVVIKRENGVQLGLEDIPEDGSPEGTFQLRSRWYRSTIPRGGAVCSPHPEREASLQCTICLRLKVPQHLSYHCSVECLKSHWHLHKEYHKQFQSTGAGDNAVDAFRNGSNTVDTWVEVAKTRTYTPTLDDVGYALRYQVQIVDRAHPGYMDPSKIQIFDTSRVRPAPNPPARHMVQLVPEVSPQASTSGRFTLLTYNLLADLYAKGDFSNTCPAWSLHWQYRKQNLLRELLAYKADILCLQEVQSDHYSDFWAPELSKAGYMPIYKKKTTELYSDNKLVIDGCATFFRKDRFSLVKKYEVEFNKAALSLAESFQNPSQKKSALNRLLKDNVALIAVLEVIEPNGIDAASRRTLICVANTHIHANPELSDVKLWQVHTLLKGLEKIADSANIPMLVAGDFNSTPGSPAHALLTQGKVDAAAVDSIDPLRFLKDQMLSHKLPLSSAYSKMAEASNAHDAKLAKQKQRLDPKLHEPLFTNLTKDFRGTLDYILYTSNSLMPTAVLELPSEVEVAAPNEQMPNAQYSSDHLALMTEFQYARPK
ncbi:hypothetical protein CEUSTIGMA_g10924.t1 [Chlamydomonas eustigma]|uniref:Endonuclease/exonuclease/phosphatase domain-containing protein n=1 Tax=Chlamydomonas eustigma TaxID=1157962 RepID=A0A250XKP7_9CHLO|nr:hypothetical protein CEUSTIGMA_g10924.t1 [Chlamydomonas eustigma]|eukprot:GAX83499.1 hypothetical protein CEUSTIGMA_g10924.t1 [Chlamydomonas eustigma]